MFYLPTSGIFAGATYATHWKLILKYSSQTCITVALQWRHNGRDSVSNHQPHDCLLNRLCRRRSKKTSKLSVTGLCAVNSPGTGEFPAQMANYAETVSIWWRHHATIITQYVCVAIHTWPKPPTFTIHNGIACGFMQCTPDEVLE